MHVLLMYVYIDALIVLGVLYMYVCMHVAYVCIVYVCMYVRHSARHSARRSLFGALYDINVSQIKYACIENVCRPIYRRADSNGSTIYVCMHACMYALCMYVCSMYAIRRAIRRADRYSARYMI